MAETGVGFTGGGKRVQNKWWVGNVRGERDGFLAGGCVGLELMMYCGSFSPTACFHQGSCETVPGEVFLLREINFKKCYICFSQLQF